MTNIKIENNRLYFTGPILIPSIDWLLKECTEILNRFQGSELIVDLSKVSRIDSAGVALLDELHDRAKGKNISVAFINAKEHIREAMQTFSSKHFSFAEKGKKASFFESVGDFAYQLWQDFLDLLFLLSDAFYYANIGLFNKKGMRKGEFINQSILIGMNAFPIVALISFLIGSILALQSAAQLRQFGASIFVADLIAISMTREMGPIMTAIIFAGRSGSSIASEIATMVVTEETDALKSMALNPVRYVLVPKIYAISITMPLLTILSMIIGIAGALMIGLVYLHIGIEPFYNEVVSALVLKDIITGLIKSIVFAWIIVIVGAYYGFRVKGGSEGVGRATTMSVVASIFMVILADSILGLIFYMGQGVIEY